jgi:hypothetical protein
VQNNHRGRWRGAGAQRVPLRGHPRRRGRPGRAYWCPRASARGAAGHVRAGAAHGADDRSAARRAGAGDPVNGVLVRRRVLLHVLLNDTGGEEDTCATQRYLSSIPNLTSC